MNGELALNELGELLIFTRPSITTLHQLCVLCVLCGVPSVFALVARMTSCPPIGRERQPLTLLFGVEGNVKERL
jgi:hypothetical protein